MMKNFQKKNTWKFTKEKIVETEIDFTEKNSIFFILGKVPGTT